MIAAVVGELVATGIVGEVVSGDGFELVAIAVGAVLGVAIDGGGVPVSGTVVVPALAEAGADVGGLAVVGGDAVASIVGGGEGEVLEGAAGLGFFADVFVGEVVVGEGEFGDGEVAVFDDVRVAHVVGTILVVGDFSDKAVAEGLFGEAVGVVVELGEDEFAVVVGFGDEATVIVIPGHDFAVGEGLGGDEVAVIVGSGESVGSVV